MQTRTARDVVCQASVRGKIDARLPVSHLPGTSGPKVNLQASLCCEWLNELYVHGVAWLGDHRTFLNIYVPVLCDVDMMYKNFLKRFINEYKSHECIWKVKSNDYTNKQKKEEAYKGLQTILKETNPSATVDDVKRKINSLRSCFRKEFRRVAQSKAKASETDTIYKPSLWYYDLLLFLKDQEVPQAIIINDDEDNILDFNEVKFK